MHGDAPIIQKRKADFSDEGLYNRTYIPMLFNYSEFLHFFGSAGSGKSRFAAQKEIIESFEPERKNRKTLIVRKVFNTLKESVYSELKTVIYDWGYGEYFDILKTPLQITNKTTGVTFLFIGLDDVEKVKSISGVDRIWIEEATELDTPQELTQLRLRLRGFDKVQITLSYNPINVHHWLNTEIHEQRPPGHFIFKSTYRDNEKMLAADPHYADYIESLKDTDPLYYKVYGLGEWGHNRQGLVYPEYSEAPQMPQREIEPGVFEDDVQFYGLDFGHNDPNALVACHVKDASPKKELFVKELLYQSHLDSNELIEEFKTLKVSKRALIICDNARPEMIDALKKAGYNAKGCTKYKGSILDGINRVKTFTIRPVAGSKNLFREIQNYSWLEKDGKYLDDEPKDAVNHLMDAMRYGTETQIIQKWTVGQRDLR